MKTFLKNDFYFQLTVFSIISIIVLIDYFAGNEDLIWLFYFGVGISQMVSYLIRYSYDYKKSVLFKIYGFLILPIFPSLFFLFVFANVNALAIVFIIIPLLSVFYSPVLAIIYLFDIYKTMQKVQPKIEYNENFS
ncbi:hypothetical protein [Chryseobacterium terrae]|uniref:Uncharacterized protein n=1 Tax=Chryseobacterium terrae TaxID=3163299 RepID=A0ABW8Y1F8_9FLAO